MDAEIEVPEAECDPIIIDFYLYNSTPMVVTVTIGTTGINLPPGWTYSADPDEVVLDPFTGITITLTITPPCNLLAEGLAPVLAGLDYENPPKIQVEGYNQEGKLIGGIEVNLVATLQHLFLPIVSRNPDS
jgi:hypothetical protein